MIITVDAASMEEVREVANKHEAAGDVLISVVPEVRGSTSQLTGFYILVFRTNQPEA